MSEQVIDNADAHRYEIHVDGQIRGYIEYADEADGARALVHTAVLPGNEGTGMGGRLVLGTFTLMRERGQPLNPVCPFVAKTLQRNPEFADLAAPTV